MHDLIHIATLELAGFLSAKLPAVSRDWWEKHVVGRLSFQQQRIVRERGHKTLQQLDFGALLRVLDQNWYELSNAIDLPREGRTWVKELQTVRNKIGTSVGGGHVGQRDIPGRRHSRTPAGDDQC